MSKPDFAAFGRAVHVLLDGQEWSSDTLDAIGGVAAELGIKIRGIDAPDKQRVLIESFHTPDSGGGFFWTPMSDPEAVEGLHREFAKDQKALDYEHLTLLEIDVAGDDAESINDYIDSHLLDLIETRQIGKILKSFDRSGIHPRITAGLS